MESMTASDLILDFDVTVETFCPADLFTALVTLRAIADAFKVGVGVRKRAGRNLCEGARRGA